MRLNVSAALRQVAFDVAEASSFYADSVGMLS